MIYSKLSLYLFFSNMTKMFKFCVQIYMIHFLHKLRTLNLFIAYIYIRIESYVSNFLFLLHAEEYETYIFDYTHLI